MELLGDVAHVESYFIPFGDADNLDVHSLRRPYHSLRNYFGQARWNSYVMWVV
jgi:hypothetical protein